MNSAPSTETESKPDQLGETVVNAGFWVLLSTLINRGFSLIQSVVIARLLFPTDLGLMGMASLAIWTLHTFTHPGIESAIIYRKHFDQDTADTAWTISIIRGLVLSILLYLAAPLVSAFFVEPRLTPLIQVLAGVVFIDGLANIWTVSFQKELNFKRQLFFSQASELASIAATIASAFLLRSVWALIIGRIVGALVRTTVSYFFDRRRPRFRYSHTISKELIGYGRHIMGTNILIFLLMQGDDAYVGRILGTAALGFYAFAFNLANIPTTLASQILAKITFPLYSKLREFPEQMARAYQKTVEYTALVAIPLTFGVVVLAPDIIIIVYGERWLPAAWPFRILCFFGLIRASNTALGAFIQAIGLPSRLVKICTAQIILLVIIIYPLSTYYDITGVSLSVTLANALALFLLLRHMRKEKGYAIWTWVTTQIPALSAALFSGAAVFFLRSLFQDIGLLGLCALFIAGAITYLACLWIAPQTRTQIRAVIHQIQPFVEKIRKPIR